MTRRQRDRERRAYNRLRRSMMGELRHVMWPDIAEASNVMDCKEGQKWRARTEARRCDRLRREREHREWRRQYDRDNFVMSVIGGIAWKMCQG